MVSYLASPSDPILYTDRREAASREAFWELWGHTPWLTVSEIAPKDPCLLALWPYATFSPLVWQGALTHSAKETRASVTSIFLALCYSLLELSLQEASCHMYELACGNQGPELRALGIKSPRPESLRFVNSLTRELGANPPQSSLEVPAAPVDPLITAL